MLHLLLVLLSHPSRHLVMLREVRHLLRRVLLHLRLPHLRVVRLLVMRPVVVFILRLHPLLHLLLVVKPVLLLLREELQLLGANHAVATGTLLGLLKFGRLCPWDYDVDVNVWLSSWEEVCAG